MSKCTGYISATLTLSNKAIIVETQTGHVRRTLRNSLFQLSVLSYFLLKKTEAQNNLPNVK